MKIDLTKKYKTANGDSVRLFADDCGHRVGYPIVGEYKDCHGYIGFWSTSGQNYLSTQLDLVEIPETVTRWVNVWVEGGEFYFGKLHKSPEDAEQARSSDASCTCLTGVLTITKGEGL